MDLMDIEKLIEDVKSIGANKKLSAWVRSTSMEAAAALSMLQAENERLWTELEQVKRALAMMWFAYVNSDKDFPHSYETEALAEAECLLGPWAECMSKYLKHGQKEG